MGRVKFSVFLPSYSFQNQEFPPHQMFIRIRDFALECEHLGYHSVWLDDHLMLGSSPVLECWTLLSALAAATTCIRVGTMVTATAFRNPALLSKMAATVDVISGGRLELGMGAGVQEQEHEAYGFPFPKAATRVSHMKEAVEIVKKMWTQPKASYNGKHYHIKDAICEPKPIQKPHPPITVGGCGEKYTLKVTAQFADRFDFGYLPTLYSYRRKLSVLEAHCEDIGRDFDEIEKSCWPTGQLILGQHQKELEQKIHALKPKGVTREDFEKFSFTGLPGEFAKMLQPYFDLGVTHFMLFFGDLPDLGGLRLFAEEVMGGKS